MKKFITTFLALVMIFGVVTSLSACKSSTKNSVVNVRTKTITVGYTDYAPMNYTDDNGTLVGFDTELALTVFNSLGYEVRFKLIEWSNKYNELNSGTIDCIWNGFTANTRDDDDGILRSEKVDFSYYYMTNAQCIVRRTSTADISSISDFENKTVSFENGSAGATFVNTIDANIYEKGVTSQMDALLNVKSGTADYAIVDVLLAQSVVGKGDYSNLAVNQGLEIEGEYYAVGFKKGSQLTEKVNVMFEAFAKIGYLQELATKYDLQNYVIVDFSNN